MLEISWSELLILAVVTLVFVGPKELPVFLRTIGRYAGMLRRQANEFKSHFDAAMREAELAQMKEEMDKMQASVNAEVMGAEKAFKDASDVSTIPAGAIKPDVATASSFTAAATAAVFPQAAQMGQVYAKPAPEPQPEPQPDPASQPLAPLPADAPVGELEPVAEAAAVPMPSAAAEFADVKRES